MELTIDKFPTLPSITTKIHPDTEDTPDIGDFSDDSVEPSLAVAHSKPIPTTFKRPRNTTLTETHVMLLSKYAENYINTILEKWISYRTLIWTKKGE